jgi:hypothetical protein
MAGSEAQEKAVQAQAEQRRLSKEQLLRPQIREEDVLLISLGGTVRIRSLSHRVRQDLRQQAKFGSPDYDDDLFTELVIIHSIVDPQFTLEEVEQFKDQNFVVWDEIITQLSMFNLLDAAGGELKKGSSEIQNSDSASD